MEETACTLCGVDDSVILFEGRDRLHGGPGLFAVRQCRQCGILFLNPRPTPEELEAYYPEEYAPFASGRRLSAWQRWNRRYAASKQIRAVMSRVPKAGRALDVGCATGTFLAALQQKGWKVQGVEINPQAAADAQNTTGGEIFVGDLLEATYASHSFDLVTFWDVLEHLPDPRLALQEAARITRSSGTLVLSLPNPHSLEARLFGPCWAGWDIPRHLWWFPRSALVRLLDETGWNAQEFMCLRGRHWLLALNLRLWMEERSYSPTLRKWILTIFRSLPVKALLWPYYAVIERMKLGSIIVAFASRKETSIA